MGTSRRVSGMVSGRNLLSPMDYITMMPQLSMTHIFSQTGLARAQRFFDFVFGFWIHLQNLLTQKLVHEEKTWEDDHGNWLTHDGKTMEQAKARVGDREV